MGVVVGGVCVCVCVLLAKYTLFIMQERKPQREKGGLFKRLTLACLLALALIPSHLPVLPCHPQWSQIID